MADKCLETDRDLIEGRIDRYSKEEGCNNFNGVSYNVNKFILNKDEEIILGGIAEEISLNKSIQEITEHIMVDSSNFNDLKTKYNIFLKDKLKSLNLVLNSINIDIFLYGEDRTFNFYMSADDSICIFNNNSKIILNDDFKKKFLNENKYFHTSKYKEFIELNNNYKDGLISKMYAIEVADNIYTLINIQYINEESIKYKDHVSITEILKKISILILQLENENNAYAPDIGIEEAIKFENIKSSFIANISHEFKTPINIIVSVVRLFIAIDKGEFKSISKEKYIDYLNMLKQNSYRLLRLVNNIVDTSKIENNFYKLRLGNYNIIKLVEDITMSISNYFSENNRKIIFDTDEEEVILCCDPDKIEKVILNLLSNALKFSEPGSDINLDISTNFEENKVYISVKNKGDLISEEYANKIFGQFIQGENILSRRAEGSGIGLYLAKHFMQMHKGDIWINLDNKECTEFILSMPIDVIYKEESIHEEVYNIDENKIIEKCNIEFSDIYE